jgi:uncharacterized protein YukE
MRENRTVRPIRSGAAPAGDPGAFDHRTIRRLINSTSPSTVGSAASAYQSAAGMLGEAQTVLFKAAKLLGESWHGDAGDAAQAALAQLRTAAGNLATAVQQTGQALQSYSGTLSYFQTNMPAEGGMGAADDAVAQATMDMLNQRIATTWSALPASVEQDLPQVSDTAGFGGPPAINDGTPSGTSASAGATLSGAGAHGGGHHASPAGHGSGTGSAGGLATAGAGSPGAVAGHQHLGGTDLAGATGVIDGTGGAAPGGLGGAPAAGGAGGAGAGGSTAGGMVIGGPGRSGGPAAIGRAGGPIGGGRSAVGSGGQSGFLAGGRGAGDGADEEERERLFWLGEDRDLWSAHGTEVPTVIGAEAWHDPADEAEPTSESTSWLEPERARWDEGRHEPVAGLITQLPEDAPQVTPGSTGEHGVDEPGADEHDLGAHALDGGTVAAVAQAVDDLDTETGGHPKDEIDELLDDLLADDT